MLCFYTFDMHVLVNKVYEKILNLVVNICLNTAYILIYVGFFKLKLYISYENQMCYMIVHYDTSFMIMI